MEHTKHRSEKRLRLVEHHFLDLMPLIKKSHIALRQFIDNISQHSQSLIKLRQSVSTETQFSSIFLCLN